MEKINLRTHDGILDEIEAIVGGVSDGKLNQDDAKIRMWGCKNAIRVMALKVIQKRFGIEDEIPALPYLQK